MKQRTVRIQFEGEVTVNVSEHLSDEDAEALANHLALARVVATTHNPDAPEAEAYDDLVEACPNITEADWDTATCELIGGSWSVPLPPATPPQFPVFVVAGSDTTVAEI